MKGAAENGVSVSGDSMYQAAKVRVYQVLWLTYPRDPVTRLFGLFIMALIILNVVAVIFQTVESLDARYPAAFRYFEMASVIVFSVEYLLRLWCCTVDERYARPVLGRLRYAVTPMALIDLLAVAPSYPMFLGLRYADTTFFRALRLFRLMRLFKTARYVHSLQVMGRVAKAKKEQIAISLMVVAVLLVVLSSLAYFAEQDAVHEPNGAEFSSIPAALWWGVTTMSTVGYGDMTPITLGGKLVGALVSLLGVGLFALPAGILASGFSEEIRSRGEHSRRCPHCGREIE